MLHSAAITSRVVLVYSFYGEQCVSRSWTRYFFFHHLERLCWRKWRLLDVLKHVLPQIQFYFEYLTIKKYLHYAIGCGLNCVAWWLFSKIWSCHKTRCKLRKQPGIVRVCSSGELSQSRGTESSWHHSGCWAVLGLNKTNLSIRAQEIKLRQVPLRALTKVCCVSLRSAVWSNGSSQPQGFPGVTSICWWPWWGVVALVSALPADEDGKKAEQKGVRYTWAVKRAAVWLVDVILVALGDQHLLGTASGATASSRVWPPTIAPAADLAPQLSLGCSGPTEAAVSWRGEMGV